MTLCLGVCGCFFCSPCFELLMDVHIQSRFKPDDENHLMKCLRCTDNSEESIILLSDFNRFDAKDLENQFISSMTDVYASKRAHAAGSWINACKQCKTRSCIPNMAVDQDRDLIDSEKEQKGVYKCPDSRCKLIYCSTCGQCIYNRYQFKLHKCSKILSK